jgi:hypothetical protein
LQYNEGVAGLAIALLSTGSAKRGNVSPQERALILREAQPNSWIALSEDESRVVGRGSTYAEAVKAAECEGVEDPVLVKTPDEWLPLVL